MNAPVNRAVSLRARRRSAILVASGALALGALVAAAALAAADNRPRSPSSSAVVPTGEMNSMGMPVIQTPGRRVATAEGTGLVATPRSWELGTVPLDVAVRPVWHLRNVGSQPFTLGQPHVQINEGCCPGDITFLGPTKLDLNQATQMTFELSMHAGMDGPHDMTIHVPVHYDDGSTDVLDLAVTGDFRG